MLREKEAMDDMEIGADRSSNRLREGFLFFALVYTFLLGLGLGVISIGVSKLGSMESQRKMSVDFSSIFVILLLPTSYNFRLGS